MDKKLAIISAAPLIAIVLGVVISSSAKFKPFLSPVEKQILAFSHQKTKIVHRQPVLVPSLANPISHEVPKVAFPKVPLDKIALPPEAKAEEKKVSLILINGGRKIAIINGIIVNEGDSIDSMRVEKIEKGRVLLKDRMWAKWIKIE
ncbi:MAG: hypothetical protein M1147_02645 [Nitrospirae bacterium]|nr:hypothetical protein [Nitrospirota bacterium]MCL5977013.1 hypothetical protein [Nitrospirota bacterium]